MRSTTDCGKCGKHVSSDAKFCVHCGGQLQAAFRGCPKCGEGTWSGDRFCRSCGYEVIQQRGGSNRDIHANRWVRGPTDVARRVAVRDLEGLLRRVLFVDEGTQALILQEGRARGLLPPGRFTFSATQGLLSSVNLDSPTEAVLLDTGEISVPLRVADVLTLENIEVACRIEAAVRIEDPHALCVNVLKSRTHLSTVELGDHIAPEVHTAVGEFVRSYSVNDLLADRAMRGDFEDYLLDQVSRSLATAGLSVSRLKVVEFESKVFSDVRKDTGELSVREQRAALNKRIRELLTQEKLDEFRSEEEFSDYLEQIQHEMGVKGVIREEEMLRILEDFRHNRDRKSLLQEFELMELADEADIRREKILLEAEEVREEIRTGGRLGRDRQEAEAETDVYRIRSDQRRLDNEIEKEKALDGIELLARLKETKRKDKRERLAMEKERLEARSQATAEALLSIIDDGSGGAGSAQKIAELEALRVKRLMTPDQMLALVAAEAPEAAQALAEKYKAEAKASEETLKIAMDHGREMREVYRESQDRTERFTQTVLNQMGEVAKTRAQGPAPNTVVTGGGGYGPPVVVGGQGIAGPSNSPPSAQNLPPAAGRPVADKGGGARSCPDCGKRAGASDTFCGNCGSSF